MKNGATSPDPLCAQVSKALTAALMFSVWLVDARGDAISELTAYYNKVDAALASAIERGELEKARNLLTLRNNVAKELAQKRRALRAVRHRHLRLKRRRLINICLFIS